jgi:hypothetical protein
VLIFASLAICAGLLPWCETEWCGGGDTTEHRFNVNLGVNITNVLNHMNPSGFVGTLTSPLFGQPTSVNTGFGGGGPGGRGGGGTANNRVLYLSIRFSF